MFRSFVRFCVLLHRAAIDVVCTGSNSAEVRRVATNDKVVFMPLLHPDTVLQHTVWWPLLTPGTATHSSTAVQTMCILF
jgi:hypothetical protein